MSEKILLVDDDTNLLGALERTLRKRFQVETAVGGEQGLAKLAESGPFAVVVADRQMPGMDGIEFLSRVRAQAPDTSRIMLTGNVDLEHAVRVVNEGNIFRFLMKPCPGEVLCKALEDALGQYRLVTAERELLSKTLSGSIKLLTDILSLVDSQSFGRAQAMRDTIGALANSLHLPNAWEVHLAVMLAPIGYVTVPPETLLKSRLGRPLSEAEEQVLARVPETAAHLLNNVPRLEGVAQLVRYQHKHFDGTGNPADAVSGESIPLGARLLKIVIDMAELQESGKTRLQAISIMLKRQGWYDPMLLAAVETWSQGGPVGRINVARLSREIKLEDLALGMELRSNVETKDGMLVLSAGHQINEMALEKIRNFSSVVGIKEPILVESYEEGMLS